MTETRIEVAGGKYGVILRDDGPSTALRYGEDKGLPTNREHALACEVRNLRERVNALENAGHGLRRAQRDYLADRGNETLGRRVGEAAAALDAVLAMGSVTPPGEAPPAGGGL